MNANPCPFAEAEPSWFKTAIRSGGGMWLASNAERKAPKFAFKRLA